MFININRLGLSCVLSLSFMLYGCHSDINGSSDPDNNDHGQPTNNVTYTLEDSHTSDVAVVASDYIIDVDLAETATSLQVGTTPTPNAQADNIQLNFVTPSQADHFIVNYSSACNALTTDQLCQIAVTPKDNDYVGQSVSYYISGSVNGQDTQLSDESFKVESLTNKYPTVIGSGATNSKTQKIIVENSTGTDVDVSKDIFTSNDPEILFDSHCNGTLENGQTCSVGVLANNEHTFTKSVNYQMINTSNHIQAMAAQISVIRPIVKVWPRNITLNSGESKKVYIINASPVAAHNIEMTPSDSEIQISNNTCTKNLAPLSACSIELNKTATPQGTYNLSVTGDNFNQSNQVSVDVVKPNYLTVSLSNKHITTNSNIQKHITVNVTNNGNYDINNLKLTTTPALENLTVNTGTSTCQDSMTLTQGASCQYDLDYNPGNITQPAYTDTMINVSGDGTLTQHKPLTVDNYPEYYTTPQNSQRFHQGLPDNYVITSFVLPNGVIYAGTNAGGLAISKDNGKTWVDLTTANGLSLNKIRALFVTQGGKNIYVGTYSGLVVSHDYGQTWIKAKDTGVGGIISAIYVVTNDNNGQPIDTVYIGTGNGAGKSFAISYDNGSSWQSKTGVPNLVSNIYVDESGIIYVASKGGLYISQDSSGNAFNLENGQDGDTLASTTIKGLLVHNGVIYVGTVNGLSVSNDGGNHYHTINKVNNGIVNNTIRDIFVKNKLIYLATDGGLSISSIANHVNMQKWHNFTVVNGLGSNKVKSVFVENHKIYVATTGGFSYSKLLNSVKLHKVIFKNTVQNLNGLANNNINQLVNENSVLYAATISGLSVSSDTGKNWATYTTEDGLADNYIRTIYVKNGVIYAGTKNGLSILPKGANQFNPKITKANGLGSNVIDSIYVTDGSIYAGTDKGLFVSTDSTGSQFNPVADHTGMLTNKQINSIYVSNDGKTIYVATNDGFYSSINSAVVFKKANDLGDYQVNTIEVSNDGQTIYVGTINGLYIGHKKNRGILSFDDPITTSSGLIGNNIQSIYVTSDDNTIYLGINKKGSQHVESNSGLSISTDGGTTWMNKLTSNGLGSNRVNSVLEMNNTIYVGTIMGIAKTELSA
ncbi:MAG: hypothetical protein EP298_03185 [Gammaproteobacteria bacterium]|nr:MAG: hypothetical protein EP298_03185 [Gammaproteobacteria bacterium]UTW43570.1 hypothetical protein KFE69_05630 [bacterium SCSIO 12844]